MKLIIIGIQGAGKSTQGNLLSKQLGIPYLSTGHIFRQISKEKTEWGRFVKETINAGHLIPDKETIAIVNEYLSRPEYKKGYILDGFPRNPHQAKEFINSVDAVVYLKIPDKEAVWRIAGRNEDRADDTVAALKKRIEIFHTHTEPVIEFYKKKNILIEVDGMRSIKSINEYILKMLGKNMGKNGLYSWKRRSRVILAIVGLAGSGKSEAADYFKKKKLPVISFGNIINNYIDEKGLEHTEKVHRHLRMEFRKEHGMASMAVLSKEKIADALEKSHIVIIEGLYSWEEYIYLRDHFKKEKVILLGIHTQKQLRYTRAARRKYRKGFYGEERDLHELLNVNKAVPIAFADYLIINEGTMDEFYNKLENVYRQVYFGIR